MNGYYYANSQNLIVKRTDVLNENAVFVTATYNFGFEILLDGVPNSNSISFKLNYNLSEFVKFSQWKRGDYDVLQAVSMDNGDGTASLIIGVSSGMYPQPSTNTTPKVIELEFVVTKNAPNLTNLWMQFERPVATAIDSSIGSNIPINTEPLNFMVHSYVNVWPGDTDNSGAVDHLDFVPISQYIGMGSATKGFRSFKRQASSALWTPQRVLTWDSSSVTYVDCDGNGDITTSDMLIVTYNLGKDTNNPHGRPIGKIQNPKTNNPEIFASQNYEIAPIYANSNQNFTGVAGYFEIDAAADFISIEKGSMLNEDNYLYFFRNDNLVYFVSSNESLRNNNTQNGELLNVYFGNKSNSEIILYELKGIDDIGNIFDLQAVTSVNNLSENLDFIITNNRIFIKSETLIDNVEIYDISGNLIYVSSKTSNHFELNLDDYTTGFYITKINYDDKQIVKTFSIIK